MPPITTETPPPTDISSPWTDAGRAVWDHVAVATKMMNVIEHLHSVPAASVIPIMSATAPSILVSPIVADTLEGVKLTTDAILRACQQQPLAVTHMSINDTWTFRFKLAGGMTVDVVTQLSATQEKPVTL